MTQTTSWRIVIRFHQEWKRGYVLTSRVQASSQRARDKIQRFFSEDVWSSRKFIRIPIKTVLVKMLQLLDDYAIAILEVYEESI